MGRSFFRPAHRDAAEPAIINALRAIGATVWPISGKDVPDLLVGYRGVTYLLEVKSRIEEAGKDRKKSYLRTTKTSDGQKAFMESWKGGPARVVHTPEEALMAVGAPVEGVLQPLRPDGRTSAEAGYVRSGHISLGPPDSEDDVLVYASTEMGHLVTPAHQKAQTALVVPKPRRKRT